MVIRAIVVTVGSFLSPTLPPFSICYSFHHPHIHPCVDLLHIFVCPIVQSLKKIPIALLTVLLSCVCVLPVASHHRLYISFVISTPVSVIKKKEESKKRRRKEYSKKKRESTSEKILKNFVLRLVAEIFSFHIQVGGNLDSSNFFFLSTSFSLDWQYRSPPCSATYSSTKTLNRDFRFEILTTSLPPPLKLSHQHHHSS